MASPGASTRSLSSSHHVEERPRGATPAASAPLIGVAPASADFVKIRNDDDDARACDASMLELEWRATACLGSLEGRGPASGARPIVAAPRRRPSTAEDRLCGRASGQSSTPRCGLGAAAASVSLRIGALAVPRRRLCEVHSRASDARVATAVYDASAIDV